MNLMQIYSDLQPDLSYIEQQLEQSIKCDQDELNESSVHLLNAGGKRIRPFFVLLAGKFGDYDLSRLQYVAVALELIHMATLVHDDVIDDSQTRRGRLTVKAKWDNRVAMYTGDYIYAKALTCVTLLQDPMIHRILSKAMVEMCIGEMEQVRYFFNTNQTLRNYLLRIRRKTALLIAISCQLGALATHTDPIICNALFRFGYYVGMTYQIRDDILDFCGSEKQLGKSPGSDLKQGNLTLPVIYALRHEEIREPLLKAIKELETENKENVDLTPIVKMISESGAFEQVETLAKRYMQKALDALEILPNGSEKTNLQEIAHFMVNRMY